ncbi:hypothetical protein PM082_021607 [Marasmius tenuissimus]|nr:hypothetical protein PM082_021607 [Marasmius tenuissimus]
MSDSTASTATCTYTRLHPSDAYPDNPRELVKTEVIRAAATVLGVLALLGVVTLIRARNRRARARAQPQSVKLVKAQKGKPQMPPGGAYDGVYNPAHF